MNNIQHGIVRWVDTKIAHIQTMYLKWESEKCRELSKVHLRLINKSATHLGEIPLDAGFQPEIDCEFPYGGTEPRIPHNIHQVWLTSPDKASPPTYFLENVKTFFKHNPDWTYFFWTNETARLLLEDRHPELLPIYDSFQEIVVKGDMIRYVLLYEFGGLYADMDVVNHRPLDVATTKYPCMLVPEPFEHAVMWYGAPYVVINAIILCRAKHPFFKQLLDAIPGRKDEKNIVYKLGPGFLTHQYKIYINNTQDVYKIEFAQNTSPYFYKGVVPATDDNGIYIPNTRFFMDSPSPALKQAVAKRCKELKLSDLPARMCKVVKERGYQRNPNSFTILEHQWTHTWSAAKKNSKYNYTSIRNMTEKLMIYSSYRNMT